MFPFRSLFSSPISSWRASARGWMLAALLPFLLLSVAGNGPHEHELRTLSALVHHGPGEQSASLQQADSPPSPAQSGVLSATIGAVHGDETLCLLCHWASVVGALLVIALALSWFAESVAVRSFARSSWFSMAPLALRSRAPPV